MPDSAQDISQAKLSVNSNIHSHSFTLTLIQNLNENISAALIELCSVLLGARL